MDTSELTIRIVPFDSLIIAIAYAIFAIAIYTLASRSKSRIGKISAYMIAYCSVTLFIKFLLFFAYYSDYYEWFNSLTSTYGFWFMLNHIRPYLLVIASLLALHFARSSVFNRVGT